MTSFVCGVMLRSTSSRSSRKSSSMRRSKRRNFAPRNSAVDSSNSYVGCSISTSSPGSNVAAIARWFARDVPADVTTHSAGTLLYFASRSIKGA